MSDLIAFAKLIENRLADADRVPYWEPAEADRYMAEVARRRDTFEQLVLRIAEAIVQPRLETLATYFPNSGPTRHHPAGHVSCWFGYCERFPASTRIEFSVEHDVRYQTLALCYDVSMTPVFIKLLEHDKLTLPLEQAEDDPIADWTQRRLLEFLEAYLRIDRGSNDSVDETAVDPVCGMRLLRSTASACGSYRGHPYFFCSKQCQERFEREPTAFVAVKTTP